MRGRPVLLLVVLLGAGCGGEPPPTSQPTFDTSAFLPLPQTVSGIPRPDVPSTILEPATVRGRLAPGVVHQVELGHCGLASPLDVDGSLWTPLGGHDGAGRPLTEEQRIELINAGRVGFVLVGPDTALLTTRLGAIVLLARSPGPRAYALCD